MQANRDPVGQKYIWGPNPCRALKGSNTILGSMEDESMWSFLGVGDGFPAKTSIKAIALI